MAPARASHSFNQLILFLRHLTVKKNTQKGARRQALLLFVFSVFVNLGGFIENVQRSYALLRMRFEMLFREFPRRYRGHLHPRGRSRHVRLVRARYRS